jgi:hypothetical protein
MFPGEISKSLGNLGEKFDGVIFDLVGEADYLLVEFGSDWNWAEFLERVHESVGKAVEAVSVLDDAFALDVVEDLADLLGRKFVMIQEFDEVRDGALEVDVVLPESIVSVDEESLGQNVSSS